jgi:hypothetical protein
MQSVLSSEQQTLFPVPLTNLHSQTLPNLTLTDKMVPRVLPSLKTHTAPTQHKELDKCFSSKGKISG